MYLRIIILMFFLLQLHEVIGRPRTEFQAGFSYNRLTWRVTNSLYSPDYTFKRNKLTLQPCLRFTTHYNIYTKDSLQKVSLSTFAGVHIFGGKSKEDTSSYKDKFAFYTFEAGVYPSFHIHKSFSAGLGFKLNYSPFVIEKYYGTLNQEDDSDREWDSDNVSDWFKKLSGNAGIIARYKIKRYTIAAEAWFGLTDLSDFKPGPATVRIIENNYRLLLGYSLGGRKK